MSNEVKKCCGFPACGRPVRSMGLCQTHYKRQRRGEALKPIALKRARREETMRHAGFSLTKQCVSALKDRAQRENWTASAVIIEILEEWARSELKPK